MQKLIFLVFFSVTTCLKNNETEKSTFHAYAKETNESKTNRHFQNALIYHVMQNGESFEVWLYTNEEKGEILFVPNNDMIQAVISKPDGTYEVYGSDENGKKFFWTEKVNEVAENEQKTTALKPLNISRKINQRNIQQRDIHCLGFRLDDVKMEGSEMLFATTEIPINSYQLYGFCRLKGDAKWPIQIDYFHLFQKNQVITHAEDKHQKLELLNLGPNPYEFDTKWYVTSNK